MADIMNEEIILTKEGYDKIVQEHEELVSVKRAEVAERIKEAISYGDISENAEGPQFHTQAVRQALNSLFRGMIPAADFVQILPPIEEMLTIFP